MDHISKDFYKSKTFWFGMLWLALGIASLFGYGDFTPDDNLVEIGQILNGIIIIVLRYVTKKPIRIMPVE